MNLFQDMLLRMPGVNSRNYRDIMNKVENLTELSTLSEEKLNTIMMNSQHAKQLWNFLHKEHDPTKTKATEYEDNKSNTGKRWKKRKR